MLVLLDSYVSNHRILMDVHITGFKLEGRRQGMENFIQMQ